MKIACLENIYLQIIKQKPVEANNLLHKETRRLISNAILNIFRTVINIHSKLKCCYQLKNWIRKMDVFRNYPEYPEFIKVIEAAVEKMMIINQKYFKRKNFPYLHIKFDYMYKKVYIRDSNMFDIIYEFEHNYLKNNNPHLLDLFINPLSKGEFEFHFEVAERIDAAMPKYTDYPDFIKPDINIKMHDIFNLNSLKLEEDTNKYLATKNNEYPCFQYSLSAILYGFLMKFIKSENENKTEGLSSLSLYFNKNNKVSDFINFCQIIRNLAQLKNPDQYIATELLIAINKKNSYACMSDFCSPFFKIASEALSPKQIERLTDFALKEPYRTVLSNFVDQSEIPNFYKIIKNAISNVRLAELSHNMNGITLTNCLICVRKHPGFSEDLEGALLFIILHELANYLQRYLMNDFSQTSKSISPRFINTFQSYKSQLVYDPSPITQSKLGKPLTEDDAYLKSFLFDENEKIIYKSGAKFLLLERDLSISQLREGFSNANIIGEEDTKDNQITIRFSFSPKEEYFIVGTCGSVWITDPNLLRIIDRNSN